MLLMLFPPFLSERCFSRPSSKYVWVAQPVIEHREPSLEFSHLLVNPKFLLHAICMLFFLVGIGFVFFDLIIKVVFWSCNSAVDYATGDRLPGKRIIR